MSVRTVSDGLQHGGNVESGLVLRMNFSPARPVFEGLRQYVVVWDAAKQRHHSVWRIEEALESS